ncbi:MAG TPA: hypothetical protein VGE72_08180 [Azospirillum sp.]
MYVDEDPGGPGTDGWVGAAVAVVVVSAALLALTSLNWSGGGTAASDQFHRLDATRQLVMVPLPR